MQSLSAIEQVLSAYEVQLYRALPGRLFGEHIQPQPGDGYEIRDVRPYEAGDTWRDIDHKVSARMGEWYVRQMYADRDVDVWLMLDVRRAMRLGAQASKFSVALHLLLLAFAWSRGSVSRLGAIRLGAEQQQGVSGLRPALQGRPMAMDTLEWLRMSPQPAVSQHQSLADSLIQAFHTVGRPSMVFVASDTFSQDAVPGLRELCHRHELTVFSVRDAVDELTLPVSGWYNLQNADDGRPASGYISQRKQEKAAAERTEEIAKFDESLGGLPLSHVNVSTADNPFDVFVNFAMNYRLERRLSA